MGASQFRRLGAQDWGALGRRFVVSTTSLVCVPTACLGVLRARKSSALSSERDGSTLVTSSDLCASQRATL